MSQAARAGPPRYLPCRPLPAYAYVPGRAPHPRRDPGGHGRGGAPEPAVPDDPSVWGDSRAFLAGVDLFNHGYYWEAHEAWEELWGRAPRGSAARRVLHGLIRLAAAGVKAREGNARGCGRHARAAAASLGAAGTGAALGLDPPGLAAAAERLAAAPPAAAALDARPAAVLGLALTLYPSPR